MAWECGGPSWSPGSGARALREDHHEALFSWAWEQGARLAGIPGKSASKPSFGSSRDVFQRERAGSALRPHRPEAEPSMAPALGQPWPDLPGLQGYCPMKGQAARCVSRHAWGPPQAQPCQGLAPGLRPQVRPTERGGAGRCCLHIATAQGPKHIGRGNGGARGWMPKPSLAQQPQGSRESKRLTVTLGRLCPFPQRRCSWGCQGAA